MMCSLTLGDFTLGGLANLRLITVNQLLGNCVARRNPTPARSAKGGSHTRVIFDIDFGLVAHV
jgi:hypothetical protein